MAESGEEKKERVGGEGEMAEASERKRKRGGGKRRKRGVRCNGVERELLTPRKRRRVVVVRRRLSLGRHARPSIGLEYVHGLGRRRRGRLQRLDISHSFIVDEKDMGIFSSRRLQLSEDEILEVSSCEREFGYCVWTDCQECRKYYYHGATAPGPWYRYWSLHW